MLLHCQLGVVHSHNTNTCCRRTLSEGSPHHTSSRRLHVVSSPDPRLGHKTICRAFLAPALDLHNNIPEPRSRVLAPVALAVVSWLYNCYAFGCSHLGRATQHHPSSSIQHPNSSSSLPFYRSVWSDFSVAPDISTAVATYSKPPPQPHPPQRQAVASNRFLGVTTHARATVYLY